MDKNNSPLKTILLDMDGVIWRGYEPVLDIQKLFEFIKLNIIFYPSYLKFIFHFLEDLL